MTEDLFGNPHSESDPSKLSEQKIEATRRKALEFFNCNPDDWDLIFTPNSTGAIKLVHDCFRDYAAEAGRNWWYGYHKDAHTSLVGVREGPRMHRCFRSDNEVEKWIDFRGLGGAVSPHNVQLFAYPAQSNMTGKRFPLEWCVLHLSGRGQIMLTLASGPDKFGIGYVGRCTLCSMQPHMHLRRSSICRMPTRLLTLWPCRFTRFSASRTWVLSS